MGVDGRGIIQSWNAGAQRLFGYAAAEMIGRRSDVLIPPGRTDELDEVSVGVATISDDFDATLERADAALYRAKSAGRNRVEQA